MRMHNKMNKSVNVIEVFSSIQGEAKYVGTRQVFVRFSGCNLRCKYCDTTLSYNETEECVLEQSAGSRTFDRMINPISYETLTERVNQLLELKHHSVSFTGGEPLCHADVIHEIAPHIQGKIYLETNGTLVDELNKVIDDVDIISMDIKLPSVTNCFLWEKHRHFLRIAAQKEVFVKLVISAETTEDEFLQAVSLVSEIDKNITFIIQPVTPLNGCKAVLPNEVIVYQNKALEELNDVRVIPQTHKFMNQM